MRVSVSVLIVASLAVLCVSEVNGFAAFANGKRVHHDRLRMHRARSAIQSQTGAPIAVTTEQAKDIAVKKATCPFIGSIVNQKLLPVHQSLDRPLGSIADVVSLGNTGKTSTLGYVLQLFATGNHAFDFNAKTGKLDEPIAAGMFALDFPGSQGSHAGHSGILQGNPHTINSGRWDETAFLRLTSKAVNGLITTQSVGEFIAENIKADPASKTVETGVTPIILADVAKLFGTVGRSVTAFIANPNISSVKSRQLAIDLTRILGADNLIGSSGEFGLLLAFLENSPATQKVKGETSFSVAEITSMFNHKLPVGWEKWTKSGLAWTKYTAALTYHARLHLIKLRKNK